MKYPAEEPFVRKQEHSLPLSVCAEVSRRLENSKIPAKREEGRAIVDVVPMLD